MFTELILFGGVVFWSMVGLLLLSLLIAESSESPGWATILLLVFLVANFLFGNLFSITKENAGWSAIAFLAYCGIGISWTFPAWLLFLRKVSRSFRNVRDGFYKLKGLQPVRMNGKQGISMDLRSSFRAEIVNKVLPYGSGLDYDTITDVLELPTFDKNVDRFYLWAVAWPASMLNTILADLIRTCLELLQAWYDRIAVKMFQS